MTGSLEWFCMVGHFAAPPSVNPIESVLRLAQSLRWREDTLRVEDQTMQHETCSDSDEECKDQKSDKSFIHGFFPACRFRFLYDTS